jgi:ubiquitin carboxyl-terminal hydrolase 9/24
VLKFLLTEGNLYLNLNRACEIWDILITNEAACTWDRQTGFEWFIESWVDLKDESKADIFKNQILTLKPSHLTLRGYECFRLYFLRVNEFEQRVQCRFNADPDNYHVEKLDLCGLNYLWDIILQVEDEQLAELATKFLLDISYEKVSHKIKRELVQLHQRFVINLV